MATDGETLSEYNYRVNLVGPSMLRSEKMNKLDDMIKRKRDYPDTAIEFLNEVEDRRRRQEASKIKNDKV